MGLKSLEKRISQNALFATKNKSHEFLPYSGSDVNVFDIELLLVMTSIK